MNVSQGLGAAPVLPAPGLDDATWLAAESAFITAAIAQMAPNLANIFANLPPILPPGAAPSAITGTLGLIAGTAPRLNDISSNYKSISDNRDALLSRVNVLTDQLSGVTRANAQLSQQVIALQQQLASVGGGAIVPGQGGGGSPVPVPPTQQPPKTMSAAAIIGSVVVVAGIGVGVWWLNRGPTRPRGPSRR